MIATNIIKSQRNRPPELENDLDGFNELTLSEMMERREALHQRFQEMGMPPDEVGEIVLEAIRDDRFYILTHPQSLANVKRRFDSILNLEQPKPRTEDPVIP